MATKKRIYLDHAATAPLDPRVKKAMEPFWIGKFGNPSSIYIEGRTAKSAIEKAREEITKVLNASSDEIIFTNGGTESDNIAILGVPSGSIITSKIEHPAVLRACQYLEEKGANVVYVKVGKDGIAGPKEIEKALTPETILVSIMYANNEIGTIQPIQEIGRVIKNYRQKQNTNFPYFHTDACQAAGYLDLDVKKLGVDLMTINGSKIYGPKGIGLLYVRRGVKIKPILHGGEQEKGLRPGTENVPAIVGLAEALKISAKEKAKESKRLEKLRDYFIKQILSKIPDTVLNGHPANRLPNNANFSILGVEGEAMVLYLDEAGVACSTGSACSSASLEPSHVIMALGRPYLYSHGSLRFSLGRKTTKSDLDYVIKILPGIVEKLRSISAVKKYGK